MTGVQVWATDLWFSASEVKRNEVLQQRFQIGSLESYPGPTRMLEGIDKIDWSQVYGSYGPVLDMPHYIRELASSDLSQSDAALRYLSDNLIHQGTRWNASAIVVPFLRRPVTLAKNQRLRSRIRSKSAN